MAVFQKRLCFGQLLRKLFDVATIATVAILANPTVSTAQQPVSSQWSMANSPVNVGRSNGRHSIEMVVNTSREITADQPFSRIRIQNPKVLDVVPLEGGNRLQVSALASGVTQIDLLAEDESVHTIEVMVLGDVRELEAILRKTFPAANIGITPIQGGCIVFGYVNNDEYVAQIVSIAQQYFPVVINKVDVTGIHTIQLETQIMEVSRTKLRALGIDWAFSSGDTTVASTVSGLLNVTGRDFATTGNQTFTVGVISDSSSFFTAIRALRQNSLVKVLASPTLTAVDGRPASFNAGGEIPIVVPAGLGQVGVQYREFGTRLDYVAKVRGNGQIWLEVRPYVSEVDPSRGVSIQGINVPGLRSRFLETGVEMGAGQTLALAGLLQVKSETINVGVPWLSDMPYLGALFRSTREEQNEIELLITVTPNFAGPMDPHEVPLTAPGTNSQSPTDGELYFRGYMETPVVGPGGQDCPPGLIEGYQGQPHLELQNATSGNGYDMVPKNPMPSSPAQMTGLRSTDSRPASGQVLMQQAPNMFQVQPQAYQSQQSTEPEPAATTRTANGVRSQIFR